MTPLNRRTIVFFAALLMLVLGTLGIAQVTLINRGWTGAEAARASVKLPADSPEAIGTCDTAGPIEVESAGGTTTTPTAYANLDGAFVAINNGSAHLGSITIEVCGNTTETWDAILNQVPGVTDVTIRPTGGARTIEGAVTGGLITLNSADNVTIDGLGTGGNSLTIVNNSTATASNTSTIRIINDATNVTIRNATLQGSTTGTPTQTGTITTPATGTVLSNGGTVTGNDNLTLSNNYITNAPAGNPTVAVNIASVSGVDTDNVTITDNKISNFYGTNGANGVIITGSPTTVNLSNNKFYLTSALAGVTANNYWEAIYFGTSGGGHVISGNFVGGANESGTGMLTASGGRFVGIDLTQVGGTIATEVQGNTVNNISWTTNASASNPGSAAFHGMMVKAGLVNIGQTSANTIGAGTGTGSATSGILVTSSSITLPGVYGIFATSTGSVSIRNNVIGAIATTGTPNAWAFRGISIAGSGSHAVTNNLIGGSTAGSITIGTVGGTSSNSVFGIQVSGTGATTSIGTTAGTGNTVQNIQLNGTNINSIFAGIVSTGTPPTLNINYNTFINNQTQSPGVATVENYQLIRVNGNSSTAININNNSMISGAVTADTFDGAVSLIHVIGGTSNTDLSIQNNSFAGFQFTGTTGSVSGDFYGIFSQNTSRYNSKNISGNTFNNLKLRHAGPLSLFYLNDATRNITFSNNSIVTGFEILGSPNSTVNIAYSGGGAGASSGTQNVTNNNFSNISIPTTATVYPIFWSPGSDTAAGATVNLTGNTVSNVTNGSAIGHVTAITSEWSPNINVTGNTVSNITSGGSVTGFKGTNFGSVLNITKNRIHSLTTNSSGTNAMGIDIANGSFSASTNNMLIANNLIGNLHAPNGGGERVIGLSMTQQEAGNLFKAYNNTIFLNATSASTNFSATGIVASTTSTADLRNNLVVNLSTPTGTGNAIAYRRTNATLTTYAAGSNNNDFYAGTPGPNNLIFFDGTNADQTIGDFKTRVATRDSNSISANANFLSTIGANANFLHINPTTPTPIDGGGSPVPEVTDDYDGNIRNATTPDIGADEFTYVAPDNTPPVITYTALSNTTSTGSRTLTITVTDASGVPTTGAGRPVMRYRKDLGVPINSQCQPTGGDNFDCVIDATLLGGLTAGNTVQYFVIAQDNADNVAVNPSAGASGFSANPPSVSTPPTTPNSFTVIGDFSGSVNVGSGETITSLTNAGGLFERLNNGVLSGNVIVNITSNLTAETGSVALNQLAEEGAGNYTVTIQASGAARQITGGNSSSLITLNGADRVQFNGLAFGPYGLIFTNNNGNGSIFQLQNDSSSNSILGCSLQRGGTANNGSGVAIVSGATTGNDNNVITGNRIGTLTTGTFRFTYGVYMQGMGAASNSNTTISGNDIYNAVRGVQTMGGVDNISIVNNNFEHSFAGGFVGVWMGALGGRTTGVNTVQGNRFHGYRSTATSIYGINIANVETANVSANRIYNFTSLSSSPTFFGIAYDGASGEASTVNITNNFITFGSAGTGTTRYFGITDNGFSGNNFTADHNTVVIRGADTGSSSTWAIVRASSRTTNHTIRNNVFINARTGGSGTHFAGGDQSPGSGTFIADGNFYAGNGQTAGAYMDFGATFAGTPVTVAQWQAGPPTRDGSSAFAEANTLNLSDIFMDVNAGDPHLKPTAPPTILKAGLTTVPDVADIDGDPRPTPDHTPDRGADELVQSEGGVFPSGAFYNASMSAPETLAGPVTITNRLWVSGAVNTNSNLISLECDAMIVTGTIYNYINGPLRKNLCAPQLIEFPVGQNAYSPVLVDVTAVAGTSSLTVAPFDSTLSGFNPAQSLSRNWEISETGNVTANLRFFYDDSDVNGNESDYRVYSRSGSGVVTNHCSGAACVDTTNNHSEWILGISSFSRWTLAQSLSPTSATVDVNGRVMTADGRPVRNVQVAINGEGLSESRFAYTGDFGYYTFTDLPVGAYVLSVNSKRFTFQNPVRLLKLSDSLLNEDFVAEPQE